MASFKDSADKLIAIIELFEKYLKDGKVGSIDLRRLKGFESLKKKVNVEDDVQTRLLEDIESRIAAIISEKKNKTGSLKKIRDAVTHIQKQESKGEKTLSDVLNAAKEYSDVFNDSEVAKLVKGTKKEQKTIVEIGNFFAKMQERRESYLENIKNKIANGTFSDTQIKKLEALLDYDKIIRQGVDKIIELNKIGKKDKRGNFRFKSAPISTFVNNLYGLQGSDLSVADILERSLHQVDMSNIITRPHLTKTVEDNQTNARVGNSKTTYPRNSGAKSRYLTKQMQGTIFKYLDDVLSLKQYKGNKAAFKHFVLNATEANLESTGKTSAKDTESINDMFGAVHGTLLNLAMSPSLPKDFQKMLLLEQWNKRGQKGEQPGFIQTLLDQQKALSKFKRYSNFNPLGDGGFSIDDSSGNTYHVNSESELPRLVTPDGKEIAPEEVHKYSAYMNQFGGLGIDKDTPVKLQEWDELIASHGFEHSEENLKTLESLYNQRDEDGNRLGYKDLGEATRANIIGAKRRRRNNILSTIQPTGRGGDDAPSLGSALGAGAQNISQILLSIGGVQHRLDEIINLLGGEATIRGSLGSATDGIEGDDINPSDEPGKGGYQREQEKSSKYRARYKSFIGMLIPELAKLLRKNPIWDAIKLLLFKFGQDHPKLAATALLAGPAVLGGIATVISKAITGSITRSIAREVAREVAGTAAGAGATRGAARAVAGTAAGASTGSVFGDTFNRTKKSVKRYNKYNNTEIQANANTSKFMREHFDVQSKGGKRAERLVNSKAYNNYINSPEYKVHSSIRSSSKSLSEFARHPVKGTGDIIKAIFNPKTWANGAKGYWNLSKGIVGTGTKALGATTMGVGKGAMAAAKGGLGLLKGAGPEAMLFTAIIGVIAGAAKPLAQAIFEPLQVLAEPLKKTMGGLGDACVGVFAAVKGVLYPLIAIGDACWELGKSVGALLGNLLKPFVKLLMGPIAVALNIVIQGFRVLGSFIGMVGKIIGTVGTIIGDVIYAIIGACKMLGDMISNSKVGRALADAWQKFDDFVQNAIATASNFFTGIADTLCGWFKAIADGFTQWWEDIKSKNKWLFDLIEKGKGNDKDKDSNSGTSVGGTPNPNAVSKDDVKVSELTGSSANKIGDAAKAVTQDIIDNKTTYGGSSKSKKLGENKSLGRCATAVTQAVKQAYGVQLTGDAWQFADQLAGNDKFTELKGYTEKDLGKLPKGAIVVQDKSKSHEWGHTFIAGGDGKGYSDFRQDKIQGGYGQMRVFMPKDSVEIQPGATTSPDSTTLGSTETSSNTNTSTDVSVNGTASTKDDVRQGLLDFARDARRRDSKETMDKMIFDTTDVTGSLGCWGIVQLNNSGQMVH